MRYSRVMCVIALIGLSAATPASQTDVPAAVPAALQEHLKNERFQVVTSLRGLPLGVRDGLQKLFAGQTLDIAEPGAAFQAAGGAANPKLPLRRLVAAACSTDHCLVYYERGGATAAWLLAIFQWTPAATRFEWGGNARAGLATLDDLRGAVLSGAVKGPVKAW